ncbi:MAG: hypothetical protein KBD00_00445 [Candidatus Peribacteraceae bacterium]|nr:hypothetical protein [Candidatus Peribacteraceae bacterium]
MLTTLMTRKEFLRYTTAFFGLFILSRLPSVADSTKISRHNPGSYGNAPYGGAKN